MSKGREELRRGVREILEGASQEMDALAEVAVPHRHQTVETRPILRLVREPAPAAASPSPAPRTLPAGPDGEPALPEAPLLLPKKGVCQAYFINRRCWEVPEAFCNTALQVCMTRECPVYHLYKDELERRFAAKYRHFW